MTRRNSGTGSKFAGMSKWGSAKEAFEFWAGRLKAFLDETHGMKAGAIQMTEHRNTRRFQR